MCANENTECVVCDRPLRGDVFLRMKIEEESVQICCPFCSQRFNQHKSFYLAKRKASQLLHHLQEQQKNQKKFNFPEGFKL